MDQGEAAMSGRNKAPPKNTYWRGSVLWCRFTVNGRPHRESLRTGDPAVAKRRLAALIEAAQGAARFGEETVTWEAAVAAWADEIAAQVSPRTSSRYATSLEQVRPAFSGKPVRAIGRTEIDHYIAARKKGGVSIATIRRDLTAVASVLAYAEDREWREGNPARDRAAKLTERRDPISLPDSASVAFVLARCSPDEAAVIRAARLSGARLDELRQLNRGDFNAADRSLHIGRGKGNKRRVVALCQEAVDLFASLPASLSTKALLPVDGRRFGDFSSTFRSKVTWAQKAAQREGRGFTPFRFHDLRHLFAVESLLIRKRGLYDLQQDMGHSTIKTTELYLQFLTAGQSREAKQAAASAGI